MKRQKNFLNIFGFMLFMCVIALMSFKNINTHSVHAIAQEEIMENNIETIARIDNFFKI